MDIKKVKIKRGSHVKVYHESTRTIEEEGSGKSKTIKNDMDGTYRDEPHDDLLMAFDDLREHVSVIVGFRKQSQKLGSVTDDELSSISVTGISIGGNDEDNYGVVITAVVKTSTGKSMVVNTPFLRFKDEESYKHIDDLDAKVDTLIQETQEYMSGKHGESNQIKMDFEDDSKQEEDAA